MTHHKQGVLVKWVTLFSIIAVFSSGAFASEADECAGKEASGAYIVAPNGGRVDLRMFLALKRDLIPYIRLGLRASDGNDDTTTEGDDDEVCDFGACECLCSDDFDDLMTRCLIVSDADACCKIDSDYC